MKIAVFGANGQLGQCFQELKNQKEDLDYRFYDKSQMDITNSSFYSRLDVGEIDVVVNCAAYTKVDLAEKEQENAYKINVLGPALLADFCKKNQILLIHFSTDYVYGPSTKPIKESHKIDPVNYYGLSKWQGEEAIRNSGAPYLIFRTAWLYSQFGHNFVKTMLKLSEDHSVIRVVEDQTGSPTYAADLAYAVDVFLYRHQKVKQIPSGTYNFANFGAVTWYGFATEILKDKKVSVVPILSKEYPTPAERPNYSVLDTTLFEEEFQQQIVDWNASLNKCMSFMKTR